mgnify:CR=1 FL=1
MIKVAGIKFSPKGRMYYFNKNDLDLKDGMEVIVETERGLQYGFVFKENKEIDESKIVSPLKDVIRIATDEDVMAISIVRIPTKEMVSVLLPFGIFVISYLPFTSVMLPIVVPFTNTDAPIIGSSVSASTTTPVTFVT